MGVPYRGRIVPHIEDIHFLKEMWFVGTKNCAFLFLKFLRKRLSMIIFKSVSNLESPKISNFLKLMIYDHPYGHNM